MERFATERGRPSPVALSASDLIRQVRDQAMFLVDCQGRIASWNEGVRLQLGWDEADWLGQPLAVAFTEPDAAVGVPEHELRQAAATGRADDDRWMRRRSGEQFFAVGMLTRLLDDGGRHVGYLKVLRDFTAAKAAERECARLLAAEALARAEAERANHTKDEFLATISHELRTPLSAIVGWAHVLEHGVLDPDTVRHGLAAISRNARLQVQLIEDLLDQNRLETGQLRLEMQRTELGGVIAAAIDSALPAATAKNVRLRMELGSAAAAVMGDPARLQQVVGNLLSNAIKFAPDGGQVVVALTQVDGQAQVAVTDTGQGIDPAFVDRIFHRFQQQDGSATRRHGGLGIGLAIVRHLVHLHGGTVAAASRGAGHGACFTITLPTLVEAAATPAERSGHAPTATMRLDGVSVLLVDDENEVRAMTVRVLQDAGAHVIAAASADEALLLLQTERPQVLLSDIGMPDADGYDLLRRVRALPAGQGGHTPAAAFTAYARAEDRQQALAAGYQMHLSKPVPPAMLVRAVAALAGSAAGSAADG